MSRFPAIAAILAAGLALSACTAGDLATARQLTIVDGALFVAENHARRQAVRQQLYNFEDEVISSCKDWARAAKFDDGVAMAQERIRVCLDFLNDSYPDLATIELLEEGADSLNDLRARFRPEQP